ncbi:hypothetical protein OH77DRAFT_540537 [Trametes cingulata]|nr:hypothetical protein OH77DRAFT_540537 [Trametes cingulata]
MFHGRPALQRQRFDLLPFYRPSCISALRCSHARPAAFIRTLLRPTARARFRRAHPSRCPDVVRCPACVPTSLICTVYQPLVPPGVGSSDEPEEEEERRRAGLSAIAWEGRAMSAPGFFCICCTLQHSVRSYVDTCSCRGGVWVYVERRGPWVSPRAVLPVSPCRHSRPGGSCDLRTAGRCPSRCGRTRSSQRLHFTL